MLTLWDSTSVNIYEREKLAKMARRHCALHQPLAERFIRLSNRVIYHPGNAISEEKLNK